MGVGEALLRNGADPQTATGLMVPGDGSFHLGDGGSQRSIPTRVGTTGEAPSAFTPSSVHPHACGDYTSPARLRAS